MNSIPVICPSQAASDNKSRFSDKKLNIYIFFTGKADARECGFDVQQNRAS